MSIRFESLGQSANVSAIEIDDGKEVLISFSTYPTHAQMALPLDVAIKLADEIIAIARNQLKEAA
jgi:hypothetical protein